LARTLASNYGNYSSERCASSPLEVGCISSRMLTLSAVITVCFVLVRVGQALYKSPEDCRLSTVEAAHETVLLKLSTAATSDFPKKLGKCALVGSSDVLHGAGWGPTIDSFDTVIRMNRLPAPAFESDFGMRTDILIQNWQLMVKYEIQFLGGKTEKQNETHASDSLKALVLVPSRRPVPDLYHEMPFPVALLDDNELLTWYSSTFRPFPQWVGCPFPSAGFKTFWYFVPLCDQVQIFGFGGHASLDGHSGCHNYGAEHRFVEAVVDGTKESTYDLSEGWSERFRMHLQLLAGKSGCIKRELGICSSTEQKRMRSGRSFLSRRAG